MCILSWVMVIKKCIIVDHSLVTGSILYVVFFPEVSHGTTQLYTFTLFHSVLLHVTIHKFWVVYLIVIYLSDISPLKRSLLFVMCLCIAKLSTGILHCKRHESTPDDNVNVALREVIRVLLNGEKMWIVHTINFRRKSVLILSITPGQKNCVNKEILGSFSHWF